MYNNLLAGSTHHIIRSLQGRIDLKSSFFRDEIEAAEAARLTVKLDGDIIMGEIIAESRAQVVFFRKHHTF